MNEKAQITKIYKLSPLQEGILFHSIRSETRGDYILQSIYTIEGEIDISAFDSAFKEIIKRHDILRTNYIYNITKIPQQIVFKKRNASVEYDDISKLNETEKKLYKDKFLRDDKARGFDLSRDQLMRVHILNYDTNAHKIIWSSHHIIMDGWSSEILVQEFFSIYNSMTNKLHLSLEEPCQYINYIKWLKNRNYDESKLFWKDYLKEYNNNILIPQKKQKSNKFAKAILTNSIDDNLVRLMENLAKKSRTTISIVIQAIWGIVLQKFNNINDVVFGLVVSGRNIDIYNIEKMIGLFLNTIPIRVTSSDDISFTDLLIKLSENLIDRSEHEYYPLSKIQNETFLKNELINNIMIIQNITRPSLNQSDYTQRTNDKLILKNSEIYQQTNYDFTMEVLFDKNIELKITYNSYLYEDKIIEKFTEHFKSVARIVTENPNMLIGHINVISNDEEQKMLEIFNDPL